MRLPTQAKPISRQQSQTRSDGGVQPSGCCAQVCLPLVGCHCVAESPFC